MPRELATAMTGVVAANKYGDFSTPPMRDPVEMTGFWAAKHHPIAPACSRWPCDCFYCGPALGGSQFQLMPRLRKTEVVLRVQQAMVKINPLVP